MTHLVTYRFGAIATLLALSACGTPETQDLTELGSGPSFLRATSGEVHGMACSFTPGEWSSVARGILENRWSAIGQFTSNGTTYTSAAQVLEALELGPYQAPGGSHSSSAGTQDFP